MEVKIAIADDKPLIIDGIKSILKKCKNIQVIFTARDKLDLLKKLETLSPNILLLDIKFSEGDSIDLCISIKEKHPKINVVILTDHQETFLIKKVMQHGILGYILKNTSPENLIKAIECVSKQEPFLDDCLKETVLDELLLRKRDSRNKILLTKRECEILVMIANECTNQEIANSLFISPRTVESHRFSICKKLNVKNTAGLVKEAFMRGLI